MATKASKKAAKRERVDLEVSIAAPPAVVWDAIVSDPAAWWGSPFLLGGEASRGLHLEAWPGGRFWEDFGPLGGGLWATVTRVRKHEHLKFSGDFGTAPGEVVLSLTPSSGGTTLKLQHVWSVPVDRETVGSYAWGWDDLLGRRLKTLIEEGERLGLAAEIAARKKAKRARKNGPA